MKKDEHDGLDTVHRLMCVRAKKKCAMKRNGAWEEKENRCYGLLEGLWNLAQSMIPCSLKPMAKLPLTLIMQNPDISQGIQKKVRKVTGEQNNHEKMGSRRTATLKNTESLSGASQQKTVIY